MTISYEQAAERLTSHDQGHVLRSWAGLSEAQKHSLLSQVEALDFDMVERMRALLRERTSGTVSVSDIEPAEAVPVWGPDRDGAILAGEDALRRGEVGVILVAGGQGSRLGFDGPKGALPLAPITQATLFAIHARKLLALERKTGGGIPFYIMTSRANDAATRQFFDENRHFGLSKDRVMCFAQGMWPALGEAGGVVMDSPDHIFLSPDGHGGVIRALVDTGMLDDMRARGLKELFYFQVDNPLVEIADAAFIGLHRARGADVSTKVCAKRDPGEGLGVAVIRGGRSAVVEYSELTDQQKCETLPDGGLKFRLGNVAVHVFSFEFLARESAVELPLHVAHKKVPTCDAGGRTVDPDAPNAYKFERFIFDVLPDAGCALNVEFRREDEFSPVKNASGPDSPETAQRDMVRKFARWLSECGIDVPRDGSGDPVHKIEIDPCFALSAEELRGRLHADLKITGDLLLG